MFHKCFGPVENSTCEELIKWYEHSPYAIVEFGELGVSLFELALLAPCPKGAGPGDHSNTKQLNTCSTTSHEPCFVNIQMYSHVVCLWNLVRARSTTTCDDFNTCVVAPYIFYSGCSVECGLREFWEESGRIFVDRGGWGWLWFGWGWVR